MVTVVFNDKTKWPLVTDISNYSLTECDDVKSISLEGEALLLAHKEFRGLPMPTYVNEYQGYQVTWYWTDAQFLARNLSTAYLLNKEATKGK